MAAVRRELAVVLAIVLVLSAFPGLPAQAAKTPKLNRKSVTVSVGSVVKLRVKNASKKAKVSWKSTKKSVIKIVKQKKTEKNAYVKIQGVKKGKAKIKAVYRLGRQKKNLVCKVTVKAAGGSEAPDEEVSAKPGSETTKNGGETAQNSVAPTEGTDAKPDGKITAAPSAKPDEKETAAPSVKPDEKETAAPSVKPDEKETAAPSVKPDGKETTAPGVEPDEKETAAPSVKPDEKETTAPSVKPDEKETAAPGVKPTGKTTTAPGVKPTEKTTTAPSAKPTEKETVAPTKGADVKPTEKVTATPDSAEETGSESPAATPESVTRHTFEPFTQSYEFFDEYTLGYSGGGIVAYQNGAKKKLSEAGAAVYNKAADNIFAQNIPNNNWWQDKITLTQPIQYTTEDGKAHRLDSMLTNFDFIADPAAIDNSENDGKLYVYGTTEGIDYEDGVLAKNVFNNHSLTILSTEDMVNWTDEGRLDNLNLTNLPSTASANQKVKNGWGYKAWAPSGLKIDGDGDGEDEYYLFYTNGGAVGYVQGDSPVGPWKDDLGTVLFNQSSPNCRNVKWCFDPAVLVDDKGDAYVYFGGGVWNDGNEAEYHPEASVALPKTARVCKIKFEQGTGKVLLDGEPQILDNYYMFEDSEINQFNGKYYYSYCTNFSVPWGDKWIGGGQIAVYVSSDPMNISFDPNGGNGDKFTDSQGIYHHYLGTVLNNPSNIYGESYNNHHHMQSFKGHDYIFYHSTALSNILYRDNKQYRNLHVDEITVNKDTDKITINPTYEGASQIEAFDPFRNTATGKEKYINATTAANSAGVTATRDDVMVLSSINGSPMVLDEIDTGDWTCIKGVDFGTTGLRNFGVEYKADHDYGMIEMFIDSPTNIANKVAALEISESTNGQYVFRNTPTTKTVTGKHDVYFVFRGDGYKVATWILSESEEGKIPEVDRSDIPIPTPAVPPAEIKTGWNESRTEYTLPLTKACVVEEGGSSLEFHSENGSVTLCYDSKYPGVWFKYPESVKEKFSSIEFTYKDSTDDGKTTFGSAVRYTDDPNTDDLAELHWGDMFMPGEGLLTQKIDLNSNKEFLQYKIFRNDCQNCYLTITSVVLKK